MRLLACVFAFGASIAAAELGIRWIDPPSARRGFTIEAMRAGRIGAMMRPSADPELYYELIPGLVTVFQGHRVVIGDDGYVKVGEDEEVRKGEGLRIAVIGASSAFGFGIASADAWPQRLRRRTVDQWSIEVELRNFSVPGYNTRQQVRVFERDALPWDPDVILWHYDHRDVFSVIGTDTEFVIPDSVGDNPLRSHLVRFLIREGHRRRIDEQRPAQETPRTHGFYPIEGTDYDRHLEQIDRSLQNAARRKVPVVMILFDAYLEAENSVSHYEELHRRPIERWRSNGAIVVDLFPRLVDWMKDHRREDLRELWVSRDPPNPHPNAEYSKMVADWVFEGGLLERRSIPGRER